MKRIVCLLLAALFAVLSVGCGEAEKESGSSAGPGSSSVRAEIINRDEYLLYQNVFYKGYGKDIDGTEVKKEGVLAVLHDAFNDRDRFYVWGFFDQTKCCDWQWEFVPGEGSELPAVGSLVTVEGTFSSSSDALDGYWIEDAAVTVKTEFTGKTADLDMLSMSCTLERVQMINVARHPEAFPGKTFTAYGRVASPDSLEDPYYDNSWEIKLSFSGDLPGTGTLVRASGAVKDGTLDAETVDTIE